MWELIKELAILYAKQQEPYDIMGEIFNYLNMGNVKVGQFFTPTHISDAIAKMSGIDESSIKDLGYIPMHEPSCGACGMVLAEAKELKCYGYDPSRNLFVNAWDLDRYCVFMSYVQLSFYDIPAKVTCGNTLLLEENFVLYTPQYFVFKQLEKEGKLKIPVCGHCKNEVTGELQKSILKPNLRICSQCYEIEQRLLLMQKIINNKGKIV